MAIAWCMDTGILSKMVTDVNMVFGSNHNYWTKPKIRENRPLVLFHGLPSIIICGASLFLSTVVFGLELIHHYLSTKGRNSLNLGKEPKRSLPKSTGSKNSQNCKIQRSKDACKIERTRPKDTLPNIHNMKLDVLGRGRAKDALPTLHTGSSLASAGSQPSVTASAGPNLSTATAVDNSSLTNWVEDEDADTLPTPQIPRPKDTLPTPQIPRPKNTPPPTLRYNRGGF